MALDRDTVLGGPRAVQNEAWDTFDNTHAPYSRIRAVALGDSPRVVDRDANLPHFTYGEPAVSALSLDGVTISKVAVPTVPGAKSFEFWFYRHGSELDLKICGPHKKRDLRQLASEVMDGMAAGAPPGP